MEVALEERKIKYFKTFSNVSILVLMEVALEAIQTNPTMGRLRTVSILVLMEVALEDNTPRN